MFTSYCFSMKIIKCVSLYQKGWQFSYLISGRNVKDLSLESGKCFTSFCLSTKISKFIPKGVAV